MPVDTNATMMDPIPSPVPGVAANDPTAPPTLGYMRQTLDDIRADRIVSDDGKTRPAKTPTHLLEERIYRFVLEGLERRGQFFRLLGIPFYLDKVHHSLMRVSMDDPKFRRLMQALNLRHRQRHTIFVMSDLENHANLAPERIPHRLSYMSKEAIYIHQNETTMYKVTSKDITEVPLGTDDVVLYAPDIRPLPSLCELQPLIDKFTPVIGTACTKLIPGLPLTEHLTTRFALDNPLSPEQAQQILVTRFLFMFASSVSTLWPMILIQGPQGSGKSTVPEIIGSLFAGSFKQLTSLPGEFRDLQASVTSRSMLFYDNIDGAGLGDPRKSAVSDLICQICTGAEMDIRKLYVDNIANTYQVQNHLIVTSRTNPFPADRTDVLRRTLVLTADAEAAQGKNKKELIDAVLANRSAIFAEVLCRMRNVLSAFTLMIPDRSYITQTEMTEYETFTLRCAEHEGSLDETAELWAAQMATYRETITESSPLVQAIRLWLGADISRAGREVSAIALFMDLTRIYEEIGLQLPYRAANGFARQLAQNYSSLKQLGFKHGRSNLRRFVSFSPSQSELEIAVRTFEDMSGRRTPPQSDPAYYLQPEDIFDEDELKTHFPDYRKKEALR